MAAPPFRAGSIAEDGAGVGAPGLAGGSGQGGQGARPPIWPPSALALRGRFLLGCVLGHWGFSDVLLADGAVGPRGAGLCGCHRAGAAARRKRKARRRGGHGTHGGPPVVLSQQTSVHKPAVLLHSFALGACDGPRGGYAKGRIAARRGGGKRREGEWRESADSGGLWRTVVDSVVTAEARGRGGEEF